MEDLPVRIEGVDLGALLEPTTRVLPPLVIASPRKRTPPARRDSPVPAQSPSTPLRGSGSGGSSPSPYYCVACQRGFKSEQTLAAHSESRKHAKAEAAMRRLRASPMMSPSSHAGPSPGSPSTPSPSRAPRSSAPSQAEDQHVALALRGAATHLTDDPQAAKELFWDACFVCAEGCLVRQAAAAMYGMLKADAVASQFDREDNDDETDGGDGNGGDGNGGNGGDGGDGDGSSLGLDLPLPFDLHVFLGRIFALGGCEAVALRHYSSALDALVDRRTLKAMARSTLADQCEFVDHTARGWSAARPGYVVAVATALWEAAALLSISSVHPASFLLYTSAAGVAVASGDLASAESILRDAMVLASHLSGAHEAVVRRRLFAASGNQADADAYAEALMELDDVVRLEASLGDTALVGAFSDRVHAAAVAYADGDAEALRRLGYNALARRVAGM